MTITRFFRATLTAAFLALAATFAQAQQTVQTWLMLNPSSQETLFVTDPAERSRLAKDGWKINGTGCIFIKAQTGTVALQRLVKSSSFGNDRIFAVSSEQAMAALKAGYTSEGVLGQASATALTPALIPVFRYSKGAQNLWLIDKTNQPWIETSGWTLKGVAFWIWPQPAA